MPDDVRGAGRKDEVGHTGIYPATGVYPEGNAPIRTPDEINSGTTGNERPAAMELDDDTPDSDALGG